MTGEVAQAIVLVAHGNAILTGDAGAGRALSLDREPFKVISLAFVRDGTTVASAPLAWIDDLRRRGARRLALTYVQARADWLPAHDTVAFAGGSGVMIATDVRPTPELWAAEWRADVGALHRRDERVWHVVYHAAEPPVPVRADEPPAARYELERARDHLQAALEAIIEFAGPSAWTTGFFAPALKLLLAPEVLVPASGLELLPPTGYGVAARRLMAAATLASSVFGGMGSWNDQGHADRRDDYEAVTERLFRATQAATAAAVNAFGVDA